MEFVDDRGSPLERCPSLFRRRSPDGLVHWRSETVPDPATLCGRMADGPVYDEPVDCGDCVAAEVHGE